MNKVVQILHTSVFSSCMKYVSHSVVQFVDCSILLGQYDPSASKNANLSNSSSCFSSLSLVSSFIFPVLYISLMYWENWRSNAVPLAVLSSLTLLHNCAKAFRPLKFHPWLLRLFTECEVYLGTGAYIVTEGLVHHVAFHHCYQPKHNTFSSLKPGSLIDCAYNRTNISV